MALAEEDPAAGLFVRLYTKALDDDAMMGLSFGAVGLWSIGLLLAKRAVADGRVSLGQLIREALGRGHTRDELDALIEELATAQLWSIEETGGYRIRGWLKYNRSADAIGSDRMNRMEAGRRANHQRWHVNEGRPTPGCSYCVSEKLVKAPVSPDECGSDPNESEADPPTNPPGSLEVERELEVENKSTVTPVGAAPAVDDLADRVWATAGIVRPGPNAGQRKTVEAIRRRGIPTATLLAKAAQAASAGDPPAYLAQVLADLMTCPPPGTAQAETRPLYDDERPNCPKCGGSGNIGGLGPDGRPESTRRCPDCTGVPA